MSLEDLIKYNKIVYGVVPKITLVPSVGGIYRYVYGDVNNRILYIPIDAPLSKVSIYSTYEDNSIFTKDYYFSKIINLFAIRKDASPTKKIVKTRIQLNFLTGLAADITTIPVNTEIYKSSQDSLVNSITLKQLSSLGVSTFSYNLSPWYLLEYDPSVQIW